MDQINGIDETLMTICSGTQGCFGLDSESGEQKGNCVYARLIQAGHTSQSLASADEKGGILWIFYTAWSTKYTSRNGH